MTLKIAGLGTAVPAHCTSQDDALDMSLNTMCVDERERRLTRVLFRRSQVDQRYTVVKHPMQSGQSRSDGEDFHGPTTRERMQLYIQHAPDLALTASRSALRNAAVSPHEISHLITVSCTGFDAPGIDIRLIDRLGLPPTTQRIHVGYMGCHGAINGLRAAQGLAAADSEAHILLCAVECCSLHYRFSWDDEGAVGNALFADGAAALTGTPCDPDDAGWTLQRTGSCILGNSGDAMSWRVGDHGFEMRLTSEVSTLIEQQLRPWLCEWLRQDGLSLEQIGCFAIHPGGPRILEAVETALELPREKTTLSWEVLAEFGNMSSPTILFILERLRQRRADLPCLVLAFGPGLVAEVALVA